jgi:hypothetical protein
VSALRLLASLRIWGAVLGTVAVLGLGFYAYLGAVVSPEENLEDLPIARSGHRCLGKTRHPW